MGDTLYKIATVLVNLICEHPYIIVGLVIVFTLATVVNFGLKMTWNYAEMPRWARFILGVTMPLALNFYHLVAKVGIQEPQLPPATPDPVPPPK